MNESNDKAIEQPQAGSIVLEPGFGRALRGMALISWKTKTSIKQIPLLAIAVLTLPAFCVFTVNPGNEKPFYRWVIDFYLSFILPLGCLFSCGGMVRDEVQSDTLGFLLCRPITRARFLIVKYICESLWVQALAFINALLFLFIGIFHQIPNSSTVIFTLMGVQVLAVFVFCALSSLFGLIHQKYLVLGLIYGFVVELGIGQIPTNINSLSMTTHVQRLMGNNQIINTLYEWSPKGSMTSVFVMLSATFFFLCLAAALLTFKEYHHSEEVQ
jgi:ABC-type transport system involved in multi-copper enzyme maturation permease subunit